MEEKHIEKIKKLLALSSSSNEHEAKSALKKAKEIMAEHKLSENDIVSEKKREVKDVRTGFTFTVYKNPWMPALASVIASNYCCESYYRHGYRAKTKNICFLGYEEDVEICIEIFRYALDCISSKTKEIFTNNKYRSNKDVYSLINGYVNGFLRGVEEAYEEQNKQQEDEWGLVMTVPKEATEITKNMNHTHINVRYIKESKLYLVEGYTDGKQFHPERRIS